MLRLQGRFLQSQLALWGYPTSKSVSVQLVALLPFNLVSLIGISVDYRSLLFGMCNMRKTGCSIENLVISGSHVYAYVAHEDAEGRRRFGTLAKQKHP